MCGIMNGLALHSGLIPYGGTFLIFSDYCKPSIRLSALIKQRVVYVMTHDSIGLGEDGPTHQPIEQLSGLRSIPNLNVFRPADTTETYECWQLALESLNSPSILALTRQKLNPIRKEFLKENKCSLGAYEISRSNQDVELTIIATGSEINLALEVSHKLATENTHSKVISMPCQELFDQQSENYKDKILNETKFTITIEAGSISCWQKYVVNKGLNFGIDDFGKSAPYKEIYNYFGLEVENITKKTKEMINK
jgi:transketolase